MDQAGNWYELFSRGARDWLRHNGRIRAAVQEHLPELIAGPDLITGPQQRRVQVPVKLLEHARFQLASAQRALGAGQGAGQAGDVLQPGSPGGVGRGGGYQDGAVSLLLELSIDDIMDWLWEEFQLPELRPRTQPLLDQTKLARE